MKKFDHIVAGSGVAGLTAALLLGLTGRRVLLLEKAPRIGGSLSRFYRDGVPFDTGFHFTGGLLPGGLFFRMLAVLGLADKVEPVFMAAENSHRFVFESAGRTFDLPSGTDAVRRALKSEFPAEHEAVDQYFDRVARVCLQTASMDLLRIGEPTPRLDEETVSLKDVLDGLTNDVLLKAIFSALGMCYGVKPSEVSFAGHSRVCFDLYESTARLRGGGDSLIRAFREAFQALDVEVRCGTWIQECGAVTDDRVDEFVLNTGDVVAADSAILTFHPRHILDLLPRSQVSKAFIARVESFERSVGFFTVYGVLDGEADPEFGSTIVSLYPDDDFDRMLDPACRGEPALVVCGSVEKVRGVPRRVVTAFEPSFLEHVAPWVDSTTGARPEGYAAYKAQHVDAIRAHLARYDRRYAGEFRVLDAASVLTFRDYLHSPDGSAYGIKQKVGQYNLVGKLPVHNFFAAGQSSILPGVAGAMMSSFIIARSVLGRDDFGRFVSGRLRT